MSQQSTAPNPPELPVSTARELGKAARGVPKWLWVVLASCVALIAIAVTLKIVVSAVSTSWDEASDAVGTNYRITSPPPAPVLPDVPISVTMRKAMLGEGYVLAFKNDGEQHLKFDVTHERRTLNQATTFSLRLDPGTQTEIGWNEGHTFYPGDTIVISHTSHASKTFAINP